MEESIFIRDLALIVISAGLAAILFRALKLPLLMGYLLAGVLISPNFMPFLLIRDQETVRELSELGVIFLMFYIGMEFDLRKIHRLFMPSLAALALQTVAMAVVGMLVAMELGWGKSEGIFLGGLLAISSSMVTIQVLRERKMMNYPHSQLAISILILEDILAILLLVVLTGMGVTGHFQWGDVWQVTFLIGVFVVVVYFLGRILIQPILKMLHSIGSIEVISLVTVAIVLGIGELAVHSHFSAALGAFLAGAILSHSSLANDIERTTAPLRTLFCAIFFVTIGMMIDPALVIKEWKLVLGLSAMVIVLKAGACYFGLVLSGQSSHASFKGALSKAQIGEFSFVIASLGQSLGVTKPEMTTIAIGVGAVTMLATFPLTMVSDRAYGSILSITPDIVAKVGGFYHNLINAVRGRLSAALLLKIIKRHALIALGYFLLFNGIILFASYASGEFLSRQVSDRLITGVWAFAGFAALIPVIGMARSINAIITTIIEQVLGNIITLGGKRHAVLRMAVRCQALLVFGSLYLVASAPYFSTGSALTFFFLFLFVLIILFWSSIKKLNLKIEVIFMDSFNQQVRSMADAKREVVRNDISEKYPWPVNVQEVLIKEGSIACGKTISEVDLREKSGATIIAVSRLNYTHFDPNPGTPIFPGDRILLLGNNTESADAMQLLNQQIGSEDLSSESVGFEVERMVLGESSPLDGNTLAGADIRKRYGINVIGIQRGAERITSPSAGEMLYANDMLLVVGRESRMRRFREDML